MRAILIGLLLAGCATAPLPINRPAGPMPTPAQAEQAVRGYLARALTDPGSLQQLQITGGPWLYDWYPGFANGGGGGHEEAWLYCVEYNARNRFGGYAGLQRSAVAVRVADGVVAAGVMVPACQ